MREGRLVTVADIGELKAHAPRKLELHFDGPAPTGAFEDLPGVRDVAVHGDQLSLSVEGSLDTVVKQAARFTVVNIESREASLEDLFLTFFGADGSAPVARDGRDGRDGEPSS